jgi:hypothetical protein
MAMLVFILVLVLLVSLFSKQRNDSSQQFETQKPLTEAYIEWTGGETPFGLTSETHAETGDSIITITGTLNKLYEESDHFYAVLMFKEQVEPVITIDLGTADTHISIKTAEDVLTNEDGNVVSGTEVHTAKSAKDIYKILNSLVNTPIKIGVLYNTSARSTDLDCSEYCKKYLDVFNKYKKSNNQLLQDQTNNKFQSEYHIGSVVEISI